MKLPASPAMWGRTSPDENSKESLRKVPPGRPDAARSEGREAMTL